jgi:hypothetical protein
MSIMHLARNLYLHDKTGGNIFYFKRAMLLAEYQFADPVPGERFRRRKNGDIFKNDWLLFTIREMLTLSYFEQDTVASYDYALVYATETRTQLVMKPSNPGDGNKFLDYVFKVNTQIGNIFKKMMRNEEALFHMQEALAAARHVANENNGESPNLIEALKNMSSVSSLLNNREEGKYAEEAYVLASEKNGLEHPDVLDSATSLIDSYL